jgi:hypothetical protein
MLTVMDVGELVLGCSRLSGAISVEAACQPATALTSVSFQ